MPGQEVLVIPPIRQSVEDTNSAQANGIAQPMTEKSWYLYWDRLGKMANRQNWMVNVGTHADRPDPGVMPNGAIYVEFDRGVIYQNWTGAWQYLAGTMYGTLSPDQRPTDLGSHDAGFDYRTTDQPPREFIWSGAAWVEVTAVTVGTHANRPAAASEAEGNLYVEYDRGGVIYQNWVGGWEYLAGTMWGTLVPDQRPTDLGTRDAGFDYRTTDAPPREFVWSGTTWIETGAEYLVNGTLIGTRPALNLIAGSNVTISGSDNAGSDRVDVTVSSSGGGTGGAVTSVFTRTGAVAAQAGDYTAAQVTNAADTTATYANPAWITSLAWAKITGAPSVSSYQTPWLSNINGAAFTLSNVSAIGVNTTVTTNAYLDVVGPSLAISSANSGAGTFRIGAGPANSDEALLFGVHTGDYSWIQAIKAGTADRNLSLNGLGGNVGIGTTSPGVLLSTGTGLAPIKVAVYDPGSGSATCYGIGVASGVLTFGASINASTGTPQMVLTSAGSLGIGVNPPTHQLHLSTDDAAKLTTNTWTIASGAAVKQKVQDLKGGLEIINQLRPTEAEYNGKGGTPEGQRVVSLIAEEVRTVLPHTVTEDADGNLGFNVHEVIHHLILAVQQLSKKIG